MRMKYIVTLLLLLVGINGEITIDIPETGEDTVTNFQQYRIRFLEKYQKKYLLMKIIFNADAQNIDVFVTDKNDETIEKSQYNCIEKECFIWISQLYYKHRTQFSMTVKCEDQCMFNFDYTFYDNIFYEENKILYAELKKEREESKIIYTPKSQSDDKVMLLLTGSSIDDIRITSLIYGDNNIGITKVFQNGFARIITKDDYVFQDNNPFIFELFHDTTIARLEHRVLKNDVMSLNLLEDHYTMLDYSKKYESECFTLKLPKKETNEEIRYIVNARSRTNNAHLFIQNEIKEEVGKGKDIINSDYFIFSTKEIENNKLCVRRSDGNTDNLVGINFQVVDLSDLSNSQPKMFELVRGAFINGYLPQNSVMYHRLLKYSVPTLNSVNLFLNVNMHKKKGNPVLYFLTINDFPKTIIKPEDIDNLKKEEKLMSVVPINDFYSYLESINEYTPHNKPLQYVGVVHCDTTADCEYELVMSNIDEEGQNILLYENVKIARPIPHGYDNTFFFNTADPDIQQIKLYLYSYVGNCDFKASYNNNNDCSYSFDGNKEVITFKNTAKDGTPSSLVGYYSLTVDAKSSCYYSLHYTTSNSKEEDTKLENVNSNEMMVITINEREKEKTFLFNNNMVTSMTKYIVTFTVLNCDVSINYNGHETRERYAQYTMTPEGDTPKNQYSFKITLLSLDSQSTNPEENCMIYAVGSEISSKKEIVLNEGVGHKASLSKAISSFYYIYPFQYISDPFLFVGKENIIILLDKFNDGEIKITYGLNNNLKKEVKVAKFSSKKIFISRNDMIEEKCENMKMCSLQIKIESGKPLITDLIDFQIQIVNNHKIPTYLPKSITKYDAVIGIDSSDYQYYVSDLPKDNTGEIIVNFVKGMGSVVAKIIKKNIRDEKLEWNQRVNLPTVGNDPSILPYDSINNRIIYTSDNTSECGIVGCEIYIGVHSIDNNQTALKEYSITLKDTSTNPNIHIKPNEYLSGLLSYNSYAYYSITFKTLSTQMIIDFANEFGEGYVNLGTMRPSKESHHWKFDGDGPMLIILASDEKIKKETLKDQEFTFALRSRIISSVDNKYIFKVNTKHIESLPTIIIGNAEETMTCETDSDTNKCHFIMPLNHYNYIKKLAICGINTENKNNDIKLYAKTIDQSEYEEKTSEEINKMIPSETVYEYKSQSQSHCFEVIFIEKQTDPDDPDVPEKPEKICNKYMLITAVSKGKLALLSTINSVQNTLKLESNEMQLFLLDRSTLKLEFESLRNTQLEMIHFQGIANIENNVNTNMINFDDDHKDVTIDINSLKSIRYIEITNNKALLLFAITYSLKSDGNVTRIDYNRQKVIRSERYFTFPLGYYLPINSEENDLLIRYDCDDFNTLDDMPAKEALFNLTAYIIDEDVIAEIKKDPTYKLKNKLILKTKYDETISSRQVQALSTEIKSFTSAKKKYIFFYVKPLDTNKYSYIEFESKVSTYHFNPNKSPFILPGKKNHYLKILNDSPQFLHLIKQKENHDNLEINLSLFSDRYTFSCNLYNDNPSSVDYKKNATDIISSFTYSYGIARITINLSKTPNGILFTVFSKESTNDYNAEEEVEYGIQTISYKTTFNHLKFNTEIVKNFTQCNFTVELKPLHKTEDKKVKGNFIMRVYPKNELTTALLTKNTVLVPFEPSRVYSVNNEEKDTIIMQGTDFPTDGEYYCSIIVNAINEYKDEKIEEKIEEVLAYPVFLIGEKEPPEPEPNPDPSNKFQWLMWIIISISVVIVIVLIIAVFIFLRKKQNDDDEPFPLYQDLDTSPN